MRSILKGATSQSVIVRIVDSLDGTPETLVENTSPGIDFWYRREGGLRVPITEVAIGNGSAAAVDDAWVSGGIIHVSDGYYRLDVPDAAFATGADGVLIGGAVTGMIVIGCYVPLLDAAPLTLTTAVPTSNTAQTLGDCLNAARAQGFGKWAISGTTLSLYANDGTTVVKAFTLAPSASAPISRTP